MHLFFALIHEAYYRRHNTFTDGHRPMVEVFDTTHTFYHRGSLPMVVRTTPVLGY
jgi:hypothetical protein